MFFAGDVALSFVGAIHYRNLPENFQNSNFVVNLEGTLLADAQEKNRKKTLKGVYNDLGAFKEFNTYFPVKCVALANNHLLDEGVLAETLEQLDRLQISHIGAARNQAEAMRSFVLEEGGQRYRIFNAAWKFTGSSLAGKNRSGVFPYEADLLFAAVDEALKTGSEKVICFFHWNYEFNLYPQPIDREIAKALIDRGCHAVIGCHSHRVQGVEFYKGHPIVYGLGNFAFASKYYKPTQSRFPAFTRQEMAFELRENGEYYCHYFDYDPAESVLKYEYSEKAEESETVKKYTPFTGYSDAEYLKWYAANKTTSFYLPVLTLSDPRVVFALKKMVIGLVNKSLIVLTKLRIYKFVKFLFGLCK